MKKFKTKFKLKKRPPAKPMGTARVRTTGIKVESRLKRLHVHGPTGDFGSTVFYDPMVKIVLPGLPENPVAVKVNGIWYRSFGKDAVLEKEWEDAG